MICRFLIELSLNNYENCFYNDNINFRFYYLNVAIMFFGNWYKNCYFTEKQASNFLNK